MHRPRAPHVMAGNCEISNRIPDADLEHGPTSTGEEKPGLKTAVDETCDCDRCRAASCGKQHRHNFEITGNRALVLSFRELQLVRIEELQDRLVTLQKDYFTSSRTEELQRQLDGALSQYGRGCFLLPLRRYFFSSEIDDNLACQKTNKKICLVASSLRNFETLSQNALSTLPKGYFFLGKACSMGERLKVYTQAKDWIAKGGRMFPPWTQSTDESPQVPRTASLARTATYGHIPETWNRATFIREVGILGFREVDKAGREERERKSASTFRITMALFGGIALIVPMLIMALHPTLIVALITASAATIIFAIILGFGARDSSGKDVLAATAAYAAVLVVFVGTSVASPPTSSG